MTDNHYPVELSAPDISPYKHGNTGVDYITTFSSGKPGPHVMLSAVVHGNELCGAITLNWLFQQNIRPKQGKLTLGFMNITAYESFNPQLPNASRFVDEDFNRLWSADVLDSERDSIELQRARAVRPVIDQVDYLLDIHSMQHTNVPLMMCGPLAKGRELASAIGMPEHIVSDVGHAAGKRMRDYAGFGNPDSAKNALLVECGQHWQSSSEVVAKQTALRFLRHYDVVADDIIEKHLEAAALPATQVIEVTGPVTIQHDVFRFAEPYRGMEVIAEQGTLIGWDGEQEVRTPYDNCVLIMPSQRLYKGQTAVRLGRIITS